MPRDFISHEKEMRLVSFGKSTREGKKYMVVLDNNGSKKTIHFGASGYDDYTTHHDEERKKRYIDRHQKREDWTNSGILTSGFWSKHLLWNKKTIATSMKDIRDRFSL